MANDLTRNPLYIDIAGAAALLTERLFVQNVRYVSVAAAVGDQAVVQDQNGVQKVAMVATGTRYTEDTTIGNNVLWSGLKVPTLTSGYIEIQLRHKLKTW